MNATATVTDLAQLFGSGPKSDLAVKFLNGRLSTDQFRRILGGLDAFERAEVIWHVDRLAVFSPHGLTPEKCACLAGLENPPAPPVTDTGDVDPGQLDSSQFLP